MDELRIIHTGDFHNKLTRNAEITLQSMRNEWENCLLLDSGDAIRSGNIGFNPHGETMLRRMSVIGYDAMAMGNREFHFMRYGMASKLKSADFPILSANIRSDRIDLARYISPFIIKHFANLRVGIFGLTVPMITRRMFVRHLSPFYFEDPIEAAQGIVSEIKDKCELLIALTHIGMDRDKQLAENVEGINLIIGGHSHTFQEMLAKIGDTYISHAGCYGKYADRIDITISDGQILDIRKTYINLSAA